MQRSRVKKVGDNIGVCSRLTVVESSQQDRMLLELQAINAALARQNSFRRSFLVGIVYGLGFVLGSAIIATFLIGFAAPFIASIPGVADLFSRGVSVLRH